MQFTKIRLSGRTDIDLPFFGLRPSNQYILKAADGLGPPEVDNFLVKGIYNGRDVQDRQIVLRVGLNPNYGVGQTAASMRTTLYGLLTPGPLDKMVVKLLNGPNLVAFTEGYVKTIEIVPFSKDPEVQITIDCTDPYLQGNPVLPNLATQNTFTVDNVGSVTTGFFLSITFTAAMSAFALYNEALGSLPQMRFDHAFVSGDTLTIDTRKGQKAVRVSHSGVWSNLIGDLSQDSSWFELHPGANQFWASDTHYTWNQFLYSPKYWGV